MSRKGHLSELVRRKDPEVRRWKSFQASFGRERIAIVRYPDLDSSTGPGGELARRARLVERRLGRRTVTVPIAGKRAAEVLVIYDPKELGDHDAARLLRRAAKKSSPDERPADLHGEVRLRKDALSAADSWLRLAPWAAALMGLLVLVFGGGVRALVPTALSAAAGASVALACSTVLGAARRFDTLFPALTVALLSVFFVRRLLDAMESGPPAVKRERVGRGLYRAVGPILLTAGVVALALVGMGASRFPGVRRPALIAAIAALVTSLASVTSAPALLALWPGKWNRAPARASLLAGWTHRVNKVLVSNHLPLLVIIALVVGGAAVFALGSPIAHRFNLLETGEISPAGGGDVPRSGTLSLVLTGRRETDFTRSKTISTIRALEDELRGHPSITSAYGPPDLAKTIGEGAATGSEATEMSRLRLRRPRLVNSFLSPDEPKARLIITTRFTDTRQLRDLAAWVERRANRTLPVEISSHVTGGLFLASHSLDSLAKALVVGLVRFMGMLFIVVIALTKDPRLGLTASGPALVVICMGGGVARLAGWPINLPLAASLTLVAMWTSSDALNALLKVARLRYGPPGVSLTASATSLRSAFLLGPFLVAAGLACRSPSLAQAGLISGVGLLVGSLVSAFTVPSLLAFMPGARLHGPLWEHTRRRVDRRAER